jgi:hypothetical protein
MTLRWKTSGGLLLVAVLGSALALAFRSSPSGLSTVAVDALPASQFGSPSRGRIVPLVVDDGGLVPAFVPTPAQRDAANAFSRPPASLPTIRASAVSEPATPPVLSAEFPRPLNLTSSRCPLSR